MKATFSFCNQNYININASKQVINQLEKLELDEEIFLLEIVKQLQSGSDQVLIPGTMQKTIIDSNSYGWKVEVSFLLRNFQTRKGLRKNFKTQVGFVLNSPTLNHLSVSYIKSFIEA